MTSMAFASAIAPAVGRWADALLTERDLRVDWKLAGE